jgi:hypothetical protein
MLPLAVDMVTSMLGESNAEQFLHIPLSHDTVCRRTADITDLNEQLTEKIRKTISHSET